MPMIRRPLPSADDIFTRVCVVAFGTISGAGLAVIVVAIAVGAVVGINHLLGF